MYRFIKESDSSAGPMNAEAEEPYSEVMRQLAYAKQELNKLKLDITSAVEEKKRAEKEMDELSSKLKSNVSLVDSMRREIEETNEEQVLVELANLEAAKELEEIKTIREKEAIQFSCEVEKTRSKISDAIHEIDCSNGYESKLAVTLSDVNLLQNELKLAKGMARNVQGNDGIRQLLSIKEELETRKKELASINKEKFQSMASMDFIRNELRHIVDETTSLNKTEQAYDLTVQKLNSKILRGNSKLETVTKSANKAVSVASNLSLALEKLRTRNETARNEMARFKAETIKTKAEINKNEAKKELTEERLDSALCELEAVKLSEALALENLKRVGENIMRGRDPGSQHGKSINLSKFEYEYLTGHAVHAQELARKKVAACQAWVEALKANEKEMSIKIEAAQRGIRESTNVAVDGEREEYNYKIQRSISVKRLNRNFTPVRRAKLKKSVSRTPRSSAILTTKMKKEVETSQA